MPVGEKLSHAFLPYSNMMYAEGSNVESDKTYNGINASYPVTDCLIFLRQQIARKTSNDDTVPSMTLLVYYLGSQLRLSLFVSSA